MKFYFPKKGTFKRRYARWILFATVTAILAFYIYARFVEPCRLVVEQVHISSSKIPPGARPIRVAFFADTHTDSEARLEPRIPEVVKSLAPDIIIFGGDALNTEEEKAVAHFRNLMSRLARIAPTFAVDGNWEEWRTGRAKPYEGTGTVVLDAESKIVDIGGTEIWIAGFGVKQPYPKDVVWKRYSDLLKQTLSGMPDDRFTIFVHHFPEVAAIAAGKGADLALAGDTHGGQIHLPLLGPLFRMNRFGRYFNEGLHEVGPGLLYVSRGIGMIGGLYPRLRLNCPPEVMLFVIGPEGG